MIIIYATVRLAICLSICLNVCMSVRVSSLSLGSSYYSYPLPLSLFLALTLPPPTGRRRILASLKPSSCVSPPPIALFSSFLCGETKTARRVACDCGAAILIKPMLNHSHYMGERVCRLCLYSSASSCAPPALPSSVVLSSVTFDVYGDMCYCYASSTADATLGRVTVLCDNYFC